MRGRKRHRKKALKKLGEYIAKVANETIMQFWYGKK